ncbi:hypothetical protein ACMD2_10034, partial [Ananas comosus]
MPTPSIWGRFEGTISPFPPQASYLAPLSHSVVSGFQSRFEELSQRRIHGVGSCDSSSSELGKSLEACAFEFQAKIKQIESENSDIAALGSGDLDAYVERMKKEISSVEEENSKISAEISGLTDMADRDLAQLDGDLEALACSLKFIDSG